MLRQHRFDYIALGVNESKESIQNFPEELKPEVVENLVLFYEWSVNWHIAPKMNDLAQRLDYAMEIYRNSGEFEILFNKYFSEALRRLSVPELKVILLNLPGSYIEGATPALLLDDAEFLN
jgi:ABC-type amino acid transport substrate-binding protein